MADEREIGELTIGAMTLRRIVESEVPLLSPFEIFPRCYLWQTHTLGMAARLPGYGR
jgi:hypothetical protein